MPTWPLSWVKHASEHVHALMHSWRSVAVSALIDEIALDWALWQSLAQPTHALHNQILEFGGTIESNLGGHWRRSTTELWDIIFRAIIQAQTYSERRYSDGQVERAITLVKSSLARSSH